MMIDLNRDIFLNNTEGFENSLLTNSNQVQPHLFIYNIAKNNIDFISYNLSKLHQLSCNDCRVSIYILIQYSLEAILKISYA